ncbi:hypothetical protein DNTS_009694 [Danionella cerebrum]|uniref:Secreted protein n=1 Tax=Danionella cerebrum TaxID=2873325 RepID=A0A553RPG6_9TELE|nr:hypothetical protein DNTS_009694 [Danionella translucida]
MSEISMFIQISIIVCTLYFRVSGSACPVLECWFVQEVSGRGGGLSVHMSQEESLMFISTEGFSEETKADLHPPEDICASRFYYVTGQ